MKRQIITIDKDKCVGCGLCVSACQEGALGMVDGKAVLLREDHCDGLGNCLPACPTGAITFETREAPAFDAEAAKETMAARKSEAEAPKFSGCPGRQSRAIIRSSPAETAAAPANLSAQSQLNQWPVQIKLVPVNAPYFRDAKLLIAADCTAFSYASFHERFMKGRITIIGCPKLDEGDYAEKLTAILRHNDIKSVTVVKMEVPCCTGLANAAITALKDSGKMIPWQLVTISTDGQIIDE
ncbi:MAG: ATP-binding protein [Christensenellales bacterium]|jgi:ferredoxin